jgi:hypothetical protein
VDLIPLPALIVAGLALGVALAAPVTAIGRCRRGEPASRVLVSTGLLVFFAVQVAAGLLLLDLTWPFTGYPMYAMHIPRAAAVEVLLLEGTARNGQRIELSGARMFADPLDLQARVLPALRDPAVQPTLAERLLRDYNRGHADPTAQLVSLRGEVEHRSLAHDGEVVRVVVPLFTYSAGSE